MKQKECCSHGQRQIKGGFALLAGLVCLVFVGRIILEILVCLVGFVLIDFGLRALQINQVTGLIDAAWSYVQHFRDNCK
jgi:hypothetical protein